MNPRYKIAQEITLNPDTFNDLKTNQNLLERWINDKEVLKEIRRFLNSNSRTYYGSNEKVIGFLNLLNDKDISINEITILPSYLFFGEGISDEKREKIYSAIRSTYNWKIMIDKPVSLTKPIFKAIAQEPNKFLEDPVLYRIEMYERYNYVISKCHPSIRYFFYECLVGERFGDLGKEISNNMTSLFTKYYSYLRNMIDNNPNIYGTHLIPLLLALPDTYDMFTRSPDTFTQSIIDLEHSMGYGSWKMFKLLIENSLVRSKFIEDPKWFLSILKVLSSTSHNTNIILNILGDQDFFGRIFENPENVKLFFSKGSGEEIGGEIDRLHDSPYRTRFVNSLTPQEVILALSTNPKLFFTSSNELLINKLKKDFSGFKGGFTEYLKSVLGPECLKSPRIANLMMRLIQHGRIMEFISEQDINWVADMIIKPLNTDYEYLYSFVDFISKLKEKNDELSKRFYNLLKTSFKKNVLDKGITQYDKKRKKMMIFISYLFDFKISKPEFDQIKKILEINYFDPNKFLINGRIHIYQVFTPTERDSYDTTIKYFSLKGGSVKTEKGDGYEKTIITTDNYTMELYIGKDENEYHRYIKNLMTDPTGKIVSYRGHSYQLEDYFPPSLLMNKQSPLILVLGGCGSAKDIPKYIEKEPKDNYIIGYLTVGRGENTNKIINVLIKSIETRKKMSWSEIEQKCVDILHMDEKLLSFPHEYSTKLAQYISY